MFSLPKATQKERSLAATDSCLPPEEISSQSAVFDATRSLQDGNLVTHILLAAEVPSPVSKHSLVVKNMGMGDISHGIVDEPRSDIIAKPTAAVIGDDDTLLSGQPTIVNTLPSPCNDLPPLPENLANAQIPKHMTTDPSPFFPSIPKHHPGKPGDNIDVPLRVGGHLTMIVDGREIAGRVMEIYPAGDLASPPERRADKETANEPISRSTHFSTAWRSDDHMPSVQKWVKARRRESEFIVQPTPYYYYPETAMAPYGHPNKGNISPTKEESAGYDQDTPISTVHQHPDVGVQVDLHHALHSPQNTDNPRATPEPIRWKVYGSEPLKVTQWRNVKVNPNKTYQCAGVLGQGSFGKVYLVLRIQDKRQFAMKIHDFRHRIRIRHAKALLKELTIQKSVARLAFLSGLIDIWYSSANFLHVITEYCPGGNLLSYVRRLTDKQMFLVVAEVCLGLISLHEKGIIHQDIKPDNILIDSEGHCVITDFGLSTLANVQTDLLISSRDPPGGTPDYTAPEIRLDVTGSSGRNKEHIFYWDHGADYWSLGATIFHLQTGESISLFSVKGWESRLDSPAIQQFMMEHSTPSTLISLVEKFTRFDRTCRWKGPRVKEAKYFHSLNSSSTAWYEIYAKKYAPFRFRHPMPVTSDASSQIHSHNDPRAKPNHEAADIRDLVEALKLRGMVIREDNSLMPRVGSLGDFIPREFPDQ